MDSVIHNWDVDAFSSGYIFIVYIHFLMVLGNYFLH